MHFIPPHVMSSENATTEPSVINTQSEPSTLCCGEESSKSVIDDLEKRGEQVVKEVITDKTLSIETAQKKLLDVISNGAKEFEQRTGRKMSYSEMRAAWG